MSRQAVRDQAFVRRLVRRLRPGRWLALALIAVTALPSPAAEAHPLGNFTTNTALALTVGSERVDALYIVDLAEIPALKVRQGLGAATGDVPATVASKWAGSECAERSRGIKATMGATSGSIGWVVSASAVTFPEGQAGLTTLRLTCELTAPVAVSAGSTLSVRDTNFGDRLGWREITAVGRGVVIETDLPAKSPSALLTSYPSDAAESASAVRSANVSVASVSAAGNVPPTAPATAPTTSSATAEASARRAAERGNNSLTRRFQSLVARDTLSPMFALGAIVLAILLGGFHALAPGHGKSLMAAYVLSRRGGRRELLTIGGTVALTHTIGVILLGLLALASTTWSPDRTLRWTGVGSGLLVVAVGVGLLRDRLRAYRSGRADGLFGVLESAGIESEVQVVGAADARGRSHPNVTHDEADQRGADYQRRHGAHDHAHPHAHAMADDGHDAHEHAHHGHGHGAHEHGDDHTHPHPHQHPRTRTSVRSRFRIGRKALNAARTDPRLTVTTHAHGGLAHSHVLPKPGVVVSRRQLVSMGLAGGLVPSPSALVVLLAAVALGRVWFGLLLVVAYGIGLALTLMGAGVVLAYFEGRLRNWSSSGGRGAVLAPVLSALPLASAFVLIGGGALLVSRALAA